MHLKEGGEVLCQRTLVAKMHDSIYIAEIIISYCHFCYVWPWITGPVMLFLISWLLYAENLRAVHHSYNCSNHFIYFFFSEHFPYFKTAPTGWKNSVRHNLSLNKCFEKIEKPSANGTNQRKGCLWAMNPAKIQKMDEEVAKWSRKDPMAIKKGMVHPRKCFWFKM